MKLKVDIRSSPLLTGSTRTIATENTRVSPSLTVDIRSSPQMMYVANVDT